MIINYTEVLELITIKLLITVIMILLTLIINSTFIAFIMKIIKYY